MQSFYEFRDKSASTRAFPWKWSFVFWQSVFLVLSVLWNITCLRVSSWQSTLVLSLKTDNAFYTSSTATQPPPHHLTHCRWMQSCELLLSWWSPFGAIHVVNFSQLFSPWGTPLPNDPACESFLLCDKLSFFLSPPAPLPRILSIPKPFYPFFALSFAQHHSKGKLICLSVHLGSSSAIKTCSVGVAPHADDLLMCLRGIKWSRQYHSSAICDVPLM